MIGVANVNLRCQPPPEFTSQSSSRGLDTQTPEHGAMDDISLLKLKISSSAVRKCLPMPVLREDNCECARGVTGFASINMECQTLPNMRSQLSSRGVDTKSTQKMAESIMCSRSQYRGVDFGASQRSGVDFMGRKAFKILKRKSPKNRLRVCTRGA